MLTSTRTSDGVIVEERAGWVRKLSPLALVAAGVVLPLLFVGDRLECGPGPGDTATCTLSRTPLVGSARVRTWPVSEIRGARLQRSAAKSDRPAYRVVLDTPAGPMPVRREFRRNLRKEQERASRITAYLDEPANNSLTMIDDMRWLGAIGGAAMLVQALVMARFAFRRRTVAFDCNRKVVEFRRTMPLRRALMERHPLGALRSVAVRRRPARVGTKTHGDRFPRRHCLELTMTGGRTIRLNEHGLLGGRERAEGIAGEIRALTGVRATVE